MREWNNCFLVGEVVKHLIITRIIRLIVKANQIPRVSLNIIGGKYKKNAITGSILLFKFAPFNDNEKDMMASKAAVVA
ncbi:hypothetical protein BCU97_10385 [Vibrio splendidus]|nr:hypothetical protein BCU97_10385 [Vibrio splendidus]